MDIAPVAPAMTGDTITGSRSGKPEAGTLTVATRNVCLTIGLTKPVKAAQNRYLSDT
jgi:hypothetical protein